MAASKSSGDTTPDRAARDRRLMALAVALGARQRGLTWPNPAVGAVLVDEADGEPLILAIGATQPGGRPHAERVALAAAGERARGATLYVSLEPCSHHGRTPPCADAVVEAGIARVVSALPDPDPRVAGQGHDRLRQAGIAVEVGCLGEEAWRAHRGHIVRVTKGRPAVTVKLARTTEGFAGVRQGPRLMITGEIANGRVHLMRAHADAVLVGLGTILADDPLLTVRLPGLEGRSPLRIVLDSGLRIPLGAQVVARARRHPTWVVTTEGAPIEAERALAAAGVEILRVPADPDGRVSLPEALRRLAERGLTSLFCEGGPALADALARQDLVDELVLVTGGSGRGRGDVPALGSALQERMDELRLVGEEQLGSDLFMFWEKP
ncbi:bifunctional diaminohydroxyphosphoribosylaminopyrimidine deaminase/5-amino-6-(5-phosphoribosylamino)uracil reductase RibD [Microvirga sp. 17 mud 1-3]|uniref:bifunctional diaminohydroxyphosphoribosylaminopyrimidine deaminase/5-amino-6-(5-phosphoribosylamino)uracil reductase RibD n=1 Tax=Microvirga sp. 17 mud 1-3 TaxID=2082949 RepID=UPI000D6BC4E3|nr:bifunctional diaminohydroxyphosphoribosylaminopyrimidine deaminase/5-amino-6-(5-phosphoribosylamino)uracil reductase RibD [Microvirga sp. 17 mud 1-3]AWM86966.1 bifunctional diaminohydroxyphosphoribosylaminopyrimidine deaminase/5-amino-6-(5-phosphoribosylamino)uracil reductase RibD [Microvirga sp. 17 mud 1-3]